MKQWQEKEFSQWVYYDDEDGKIIGAVYKIGNTVGIWGAKVYHDGSDGVLGQFIDSTYAKKSIENFWDIMSRTLLENNI